MDDLRSWNGLFPQTNPEPTQDFDPTLFHLADVSSESHTDVVRCQERPLFAEGRWGVDEEGGSPGPVKVVQGGRLPGVPWRLLLPPTWSADLGAPKLG
jgi:hypothetical protein